MQEFLITIEIFKGLSRCASNLKEISVGLDDLDPEMSDLEIKHCAIKEAERELYNSPDFKFYGKNWQVVDFEKI